MYTLVLMSAVAAGPDVSRFDGYGCFGSCHGSACYGGPLFPRARAFFAGVGDGLRGAFAPIGTYRAWGCHGAACFGSCAGCHGSCFGSCAGCAGAVYHGSAVYGGCYGTSCAGCLGSCFGCGGGGCVGLPAIPAVSYDAVPMATVAMKPAAETGAASLVVSLPAAAKLYVDGQLVAGDGVSRRFHTPPLEAGRTYYYELKAEVLVGGKVEAEEAKVVIRAGDTKDVGFARLAAAVAARDSLATR